ncbi:MAG: phosphopantetheine-binding protein [Clostridia bacterium]|nr:phosphopantetheine-binding protein [Clostridia bacterium]
MEGLIEKILEYVEPDEEITPDSALKADCGLTSFDLVCITEDLSRERGMKADKVNIRACVTVKDLAVLFGIE